MAERIDVLRQRVGGRPPAPEGAPTEGRQCEEHGEYQAAVWSVTIGRVTRKMESPCPQCLLELKGREGLARHKAARSALEAHRARLRASSGVGELFAGTDIRQYTPMLRGQVPAATRLIEIVQSVETPSADGVILIGVPGVGKTHMLCAAVNAVIDRGYSARYMTAAELIREIRGTWGHKGPSEDEVIRAMIGVRLLAIDELGVQYGTDSEKYLMHAVIDGRMREKRPTIYGSNVPFADLAPVVGERVHDRMRQFCDVFEIAGRSLREKMKGKT